MHPTEETLLAFATGRADLPRRVMVEGHLDTCAGCRAAVGEISAPGGALLTGLSAAPSGAPPSDRLWERVRQGLTPPAQMPASGSPLAGMPLPAGVLAELSELPAIPELRWRWALARGGRYAVLLRDPFTHSALIVGHIPPRRIYPRHVHVGWEDVLILTGAYEDDFGSWPAGTYATYAPGTQHRPVIQPGDECWTLTRLERPNRLLGGWGWVQRLVG